ncbi:5'-adenylylsulfate reductase-like 5 [Macadamia integrifolia]|uniref:5'-adenylylsulfate reductase-like 5 n=1 Tax=Macadamia integrifolia TaxID=60698 RepID=UPI001C4F012C|nr:5'-adenylylsulfate reductase-like 5 [Macadamia integrifolia]
MAASTVSIIFICIFAISTLRLASSSTVCLPQSHIFLSNLQSQCPTAITPFSHIEVDGESLDKALSSNQKNLNTAVLFYASWCPFSCGVLPTFDALNSMFPQIRHLAVEQSSALPSLFSRYGIHSLPAIFLVNQTARVRYCGPKDLSSLIQFYMRITGIKPVGYFTVDRPSCSGDDKTLLQLWNGSSVKEILRREPHLILAVLFLCLRAFMYFFPAMLSRFKAFWISYIPHLNLGIFGETSQLLGRAVNMIDVKRVFSKLRLSKTRNFQKGAKNARVWASSLTSVSLGESSSARTIPCGDL